MNVKPYIDLINRMAGQPRKLFCAYCGAQTVVTGQSGICSNCESIVYHTLDDIQASSPVIIGLLSRINALTEKGDYAGAAAEYDKLIAANKDDANLFYAAGLFYIKYSNYEVSKINYSLPGFMEQNSQQRHRANDLTSKARLMLNRAIYISDATVAKGTDQARQMYIRFLCSVKLNKLREAQGSIQKIKSLNDEALAKYTELVLNLNAANYNYVIDHAKELLDDKTFYINAAFYLSVALFKKRMYRDSEIIANALKSSVTSNNVNELLGEIAAAKASF
jgi:tetratricopeptide (TPR) repeat protein